MRARRTGQTSVRSRGRNSTSPPHDGMLESAPEAPETVDDLKVMRAELDALRLEISELKAASVASNGESSARQTPTQLERSQAETSSAVPKAHNVSSDEQKLLTLSLSHQGGTVTEEGSCEVVSASALGQQATAQGLTAVVDERARSSWPAGISSQAAPFIQGNARDDHALSESMAPDAWISSLGGEESAATQRYAVPSAIDPTSGVEPYDGDPRKWDMFIGSFKALVHDTIPSDAVRIAYLGRLLAPRVRDSVATYLYNPALYHQALQTLKRKYGDRRLIAQYSVNALRCIKPLRREDIAGLDRFVCELHGVVSSLMKTGNELEVHSVGNLHDVVKKLTPHLRERWLENARRLSRPVNLLDLDEWLSELVLTKRSAAIFDADDDRSEQRRVVKSKAYGEPRVNAVTSKPIKATQTCAHCQRRHRLRECPDFNALSVEERTSVVKNAKHCFSCLEAGHVARNCKEGRICGINGCKGRHNALIHRSASMHSGGVESPLPEQPSGAPETVHIGTASHASNATVLLSVVPVLLRGPNGLNVTSALLDPGSEVTLITEEMASKLGLARKTSMVRLATFCGSVPVTTSAMVSFEVSSTDGEYTVKVKDAITVPGLNLARRVMDWPRLKGNWPHLSDIPLPALDYSSVHILLGADVIDVHRQLEVRLPAEDDQPYAIRGPLGWTAIGPLNCRPDHPDHARLVNKVTRNDE
uniref:CCHC-type domain-containing protein n=1 Tax=Trichuris muris TaxID=70415 RepID=A0A5S6Q0Z1_TRIMR